MRCFFLSLMNERRTLAVRHLVVGLYDHTHLVAREAITADQLDRLDMPGWTVSRLLALMPPTVTLLEQRLGSFSNAMADLSLREGGWCCDSMAISWHMVHLRHDYLND